MAAWRLVLLPFFIAGLARSRDVQSPRNLRKHRTPLQSIL